MKEYRVKYECMLGTLEIVSNEHKIIKIDLVKDDFENSENIPQVLKNCVTELDEYFAGTRKVFTVDFELNGTDFQKKVWKALMKIPYGTTMTYKETAILAGNEKACRAVGNANNKNKIIIIIPCHRVIGANGNLVGYGCELDVKEKLLNLEAKNKD